MRQPRNRGQALVLVSFGLVAMCGMAGLAVDLGWSYFVKKQAQTAADAAALAGVEAAIEGVTTLTCGVNVICQPATECAAQPVNPPQNNLDHACLYAQANGFTTGGHDGRQRVVLAAGVTSPAPTVPGVAVDYWVTATVSEQIPLLFARLFSSAAVTSTRSTAAAVNSAVGGSLLLLNHENDCLPMETTSQLTCGVNLLVSANDNQTGSAVRADGGIYLASQKNGTSGDARYAGENTGGGTVRAPFTYIRGNGWYKLGGSSAWDARPQQRSDADFGDPMRGKGQPAPPSGLVDHAVSGGSIQGSSNPDSPLVLTPGNYYAVDAQGNATGDRLSINGYVKFSAGASGFGQYVIFGGVNVAQGGTTTFEPGMYVLAGTKYQAGRPSPLFTMTSSAIANDLTSGYGANGDAGEIFIFSDTNYSGQGQTLQVPAALAGVAASLKQGTAGFVTSNANATINLHGLNRNGAGLPSGLKNFAPVVVWQDQANSVVKYTADGNIDTGCGNPDGCPNTALASNESAQMAVQGSPNMHYYGTVYQPRGAFTNIIGGGSYEVPIQIIAGAFRVQGNANLSMAPVPSPVMRRIAALVE